MTEDGGGSLVEGADGEGVKVEAGAVDVTIAGYALRDAEVPDVRFGPECEHGFLMFGLFDVEGRDEVEVDGENALF